MVYVQQQPGAKVQLTLHMLLLTNTQHLKPRASYTYHHHCDSRGTETAILFPVQQRNQYMTAGNQTYDPMFHDSL